MTDGDFTRWINQKRLRRQLKWAVETSLADDHNLEKVHILGLSNAGYDYILQAFRLLVDGWDKSEHDAGLIVSAMDMHHVLQMSFDEVNDEKGEEPFPAYTMGRDPLTLDAIRDEAPE